MSSRIKIRIEDASGKEIWIPCGECDRETCHKVLTWVATTDESPSGDVQVWNDYIIVECNGCKSLSFCHEYRCSEDTYYDNETESEELVTTYKYYPSRMAGRQMMQESYLLPHGVYKIYEEAIGASCNKFQILTGAGIRSIVEAVCIDKGMTGKDLQDKIDGLASAGLITSDGAKILHNLRFMGNEAVHKLKAHSEEEIGAAFDVVEYLLTGVYVLPKKAAKLPKKSS